MVEICLMACENGRVILCYALLLFNNKESCKGLDKGMV